MFFTADETDAVKTKMSGSSSGGVDVVRPGATEGEQGIEIILSGVDQVVFLFAPFIAAEQRMDQVVAFDVECDFRLFEKVAAQLLQGAVG